METQGEAKEMILIFIDWILRMIKIKRRSMQDD